MWERKRMCPDAVYRFTTPAKDRLYAGSKDEKALLQEHDEVVQQFQVPAEKTAHNWKVLRAREAFPGMDPVDPEQGYIFFKEEDGNVWARHKDSITTIT